MSKLYGIICPSGRMMHRANKIDGSIEPAWYTERENLREFFSYDRDKVVILDTETLFVTIEDRL